MSIQFFDIHLPVQVWSHTVDLAPVLHTMTVRITMGPDATAEDVVKEFARKIELACGTIDVGDEE